MASTYTHSCTIYNNYLGVSKTIKAQSSYELQMKCDAQKEKWAKQEELRRERERVEDLKYKAEQMDLEQKQEVESYKTLLSDSVGINNKVQWERLKKTAKYNDFAFNESPPDIDKIKNELNIPPKSFVEKIFVSRKNKREDLEKKALGIFEGRTRSYNQNKEKKYNEWQEKKIAFEQEQQQYNLNIEKQKSDYENRKKEGIEWYFEYILLNMKVPDSLNLECVADFIQESNTLIVSLFIPSIDEFLNISGYKYVASTKTIKEIPFKAKEFEKFYDETVKQLALKVIYEMFNADYISCLDAIVFNGWVNGVNKSNGQDFTSCILSIQITKEKFKTINFERIDATECVKDLKGIYAGSLSQLAPVKPILDINREDSRFVESREILDSINSEDNLATMPWEDFEHLVRELFEKYFCKNGAEIKVTQSSRDGGVDAIAFDPDPIRGGKFVIQAKRYNRVVPVSAVRDLYGTMINEGAAKGILVTTSYYGNDSREFAKDKPISLIDGQNLIYMFSEYGYKVRIELA